MKHKNFTIPNFITICRLIIIIFAGKYLLGNNIVNSFVLYLAAIITDFLDGFLARALKQTSNLGKILDPIADKLMIGSAIIILIYKEMMPIWYGLVFVICSLISLIGGLFLIKKFKYIPTPNLLGKVAAVVSMLTFLFNIAYYMYAEILFYIYLISATLLILSLILYVYKSYKGIITTENNISSIRKQ